MTKIEALQKTIYNLENDVYEYNWCYWDTCNCGVLARTLMDGKKPSEAGSHLYDKFLAPTAGFSGQCIDTVKYCSTTGMPIPEVFEALYKNGFTGEELRGLENMNNEEILSRAAVRLKYNYKFDLIQYLKAWVSILQ